MSPLPRSTSRVEWLFRSPWFWLALIFVACQISSLVRGKGFVLKPDTLWLMINYAFIFVILLPKEAFGIRNIDSGTIYGVIITTGCALYVLFAFGARWIPRRFLYWTCFSVLGVVLFMSAGCTAWVLSWHR